jgi:hypothetical protein
MGLEMDTYPSDHLSFYFLSFSFSISMLFGLSDILNFDFIILLRCRLALRFTA